MLKKPKFSVFSDGTSYGGGSEVEKFTEAFHGYRSSFSGSLVGVTSSHSAGGVMKRAERNEIPFIHFPSPWTAEGYQSIALASGAEFFIFVDWLKPVRGLDSSTVFNSRTVVNFHLGPFPECGQHGQVGFYGKDIYGYTLRKYKSGEIKNSAVIAHFVTETFSEDSIISRIKVKIEKEDTVSSLEQRTKETLYRHLSVIVNNIINEKIKLCELNPISIKFPDGYSVEI